MWDVRALTSAHFILITGSVGRRLALFLAITVVN